jgi:hypothetical protein
MLVTPPWNSPKKNDAMATPINAMVPELAQTQHTHTHAHAHTQRSRKLSGVKAPAGRGGSGQRFTKRAAPWMRRWCGDKGRVRVGGGRGGNAANRERRTASLWPCIIVLK